MGPPDGFIKISRSLFTSGASGSQAAWSVWHRLQFSLSYPGTRCSLCTAILIGDLSEDLVSHRTTCEAG